MTDRSRLEALVTRFPHLQGLLLVPIGLWVALNSSLSLWWPWRDELLAVPAAAVAAAAYLFTRSFYRRAFGRMSPATSHHTAVTIWTALFMVAGIAAMEVDARALVPISVTAIVFAFGFTAYWWVATGYRWYHALAGAALVGAGLSPVWTSLQGAEVFRLVGAVAGAALVLVGLFDHIELTRTFDRLHTGGDRDARKLGDVV